MGVDLTFAKAFGWFSVAVIVMSIGASLLISAITGNRDVFQFLFPLLVVYSGLVAIAALAVLAYVRIRAMYQEGR